jgi:hypothetical protein
VSVLSSTLTATTHSLLGHAQLVTLYFPREIPPLTCVIAGLFDSCSLGGPWRALAIYQCRSRCVLCAVGHRAGDLRHLGLLFSAVQVRFRDVGVALPPAQLWLFAVPCSTRSASARASRAHFQH